MGIWKALKYYVLPDIQEMAVDLIDYSGRLG